MKLRLKILVLVIGILVISLATLAVPVYWYTRTALEEEFNQRLLTVLRLASESVDKELLSALTSEPSLPKVRSDLAGQLQRFTQSGIRGIEIYAGEETPIVRAGSAFPEPSLFPQISLANEGGEDPVRETVSEIYRIEEDRYVKFALMRFDIAGDRPVTGIIWSEVQFMSYFDQLKGSLFWITVVAIAVAVVLVILFSRTLIRPVERLAGYAKSIQKNLNTEAVHLDRKDEFGDLNRALAEMHTELRENEERNKQLLSGIAHEIKNPLGGLELYTGLLEEESGSSDEHKVYFRNISQALRNLNQTVTSYLDYARPRKSELQVLFVREVVEDVAHIIRPELDNRGIGFHINGEGRVLGDKSKLRRVMLNLLRNAMEAVSEECGTIEVSISEKDKQVEICIEDNGSGIPASELETIFEPYYTTSEKGYGLGLPIAKNLIEEMHGTIFVESTVEEGTTFRLLLPKADSDG